MKVTPVVSADLQTGQQNVPDQVIVEPTNQADPVEAEMEERVREAERRYEEYKDILGDVVHEMQIKYYDIWDYNENTIDMNCE